MHFHAEQSKPCQTCSIDFISCLKHMDAKMAQHGMIPLTLHTID